MDETGQGRNRRQRTIGRSNIRRVLSLPNCNISGPSLWTDVQTHGIYPTSNDPLGTTIESVPGYVSDEQQVIGHVSVGPFEASSPPAGILDTSFDINIYQQKKTLAQGMMDLALLSANANQMRYVLQYQDQSFYSVAISMITLSLILQVIVGVGLIWNSTYNVKKQAHTRQANKSNDWTIIGIFLVTILNVFISSFAISTQSMMLPQNNGALHPGNYDISHKVNSATNT